MNLNFFSSEPVSEITSITNYETINGYTVTTTWNKAGTRDGRDTKSKADTWSITVQPNHNRLYGTYNTRTIIGRGSIQYMNEIKDQTIASMGALSEADQPENLNVGFAQAEPR